MKMAWLVLAFLPSVLVAQEIFSITPASGITRGGEIVHLHGASLTGATGIRFGEVSASIVDNTPGEIVVIAPPHAAGLVDVHVIVEPPITIVSGYGYQNTRADDRVRVLLPIAVGP